MCIFEMLRIPNGIRETAAPISTRKFNSVLYGVTENATENDWAPPAVAH